MSEIRNNNNNNSGGILRVVARSPSAYTAGEPNNADGSHGPNGPNGPNNLASNGPDGKSNGRVWGAGWTRAGQIVGGVAVTGALVGLTHLAKKTVSAYLWPDHPRRARVPKVRLDQTTWRCPSHADHDVAPSAQGLATSVEGILSDCIDRAIKSRGGGRLARFLRGYKDVKDGIAFWYEAKGGDTMQTVRSHLHLCLSRLALDPDVIATALYAGFEYARIGALRGRAESLGSDLDDREYGLPMEIEQKRVAASRGDMWDVTMCCGHSASKWYCERYQRAIAAASRVVVYRTDQWNSLHEDGVEGAWLPSRDDFGRRADLEAATCTAAETDAVSLCAEFRAKSAQRVGIMVFSDGRPGGAVWSEMSEDFDANVVVNVGVYTTHESAVVSAWLRGECPAGPAGPAGADGNRERADSIRRHFQATIASRWSSSARTKEYDMYGDVWVVRNAVLDTTRYGPRNADGSASNLQSAKLIPMNLTNATNVTLVFVNVRVDANGAERSLDLAVKAGLDAMIVEGVSVAIVAVDPPVGGAQGIVNGALAERPNEPKSHEGEQAFGMISARQAGDDHIGFYGPNLVDARPRQPHPELAVPLDSTAQSAYHTTSACSHSLLRECTYNETTAPPSGHSVPVAPRSRLPMDAHTTRGHYFSAVRFAAQVNPPPTQYAYASGNGQGRTRQGYAQQGYAQQGYPQQGYPQLVFGSSTRAASRFV